MVPDGQVAWQRLSSMPQCIPHPTLVSAALYLFVWKWCYQNGSENTTGRACVSTSLGVYWGRVDATGVISTRRGHGRRAIGVL